MNGLETRALVAAQLVAASDGWKQWLRCSHEDLVKACALADSICSWASDVQPGEPPALAPSPSTGPQPRIQQGPTQAAMPVPTLAPIAPPWQSPTTHPTRSVGVTPTPSPTSADSRPMAPVIGAPSPPTQMGVYEPGPSVAPLPPMAPPQGPSTRE